MGVEVPARLATMVGTRSLYWDIPQEDLLILFALLGAEHQAALDGNSWLQAKIRTDMQTLITIHGYAVEEILNLNEMTRG